MPNKTYRAPPRYKISDFFSSLLKGSVTLRKKFSDKFGDRYSTVRQYYVPRKGLVVIQDVSPFVPELVAMAVEAAEAEEE